MKRAVVVGAIRTLLESRLQEAEDRLSALRESLTSESRSTAGDKHETGRAMVQLEIEQAEASRARARESLDQLLSVLSGTPRKVVSAGSLVETNRGHFFIGPSIGKVSTAQGEVFAISATSPVGQVLLGLAEGEERHFQASRLRVTGLA